jgi:hypothetical protein
MARKISRQARSFISRKIRRLRREKYPEKQAVAIAFAMARHHGFKVPRKPHNPDHHDHR